MLRVQNIKHIKISALVAGALSSFAFAPVFAWPVFAAALCFVLEMCESAQTYKRASAVGYFYGFGLFSAGFYWVGNALLVDAEHFGFLYPITLLASGAFFGLFVLPSFAVWHFFKKDNIWVKILAFCSVFVLFEYVRAFFLTGFPWNMTGTMFAFSDVLIQISSVIGAYGLSFVTLVLACSFYAFIKGFYKSAVSVFLILTFTMYGFGIWRLQNNIYQPSNIKARIVQPSIPQDIKWDRGSLEENLETYIKMSRQNGFEDVKVVVWGETATAFNPEDSVYYKEKIRTAVPQNGYLMTGVLRYDEKEDKAYNSMSVIDQYGKTVAFYDKNHLVPFGEYIPFRSHLPAFIKPVANAIDDLSFGQKYKTLKVKGLAPFSALICYEIIFPGEVIDPKNKPDWLVLASNDGWYGDSFGPHQHLVSAKMRAVEEGITILRSANNGISALIDPLGRVVDKADLNEKKVLDVYLPQKLNILTIYNQLRNLPILTLVLGVLLSFILIRYRRSKS